MSDLSEREQDLVHELAELCDLTIKAIRRQDWHAVDLWCVAIERARWDFRTVRGRERMNRRKTAA